MKKLELIEEQKSIEITQFYTKLTNEGKVHYLNCYTSYGVEDYETKKAQATEYYNNTLSLLKKKQDFELQTKVLATWEG